MAVIASIDGRDWVLGMEWSTYKSVPKREELLKDAGEDQAGEVQAPWYSLRITDEAIQAGFCEALGDVKRPKKLASLGAMLADARQQPWLGVFEISEDVYWYIAVRDHYAILPGGDVVGSEAEVFAARNAHAGFAGWTFVEGDLETLTGLISEVDAKRTPVRSLTVSRIDPVPTAIATAVALLLLCSIGVGTHFYRAHVKAAREAQQRLAVSQQPVEHIPTAGEFLLKSPAPNDWLQACRESLGTLDISSNGWRVAAAGCNDAIASVRWVRGEGATVEAPPPGTMDLSGEFSNQIIQIKPPARFGSDNAADMRTEILALRAWGQRYGSTPVVSTPQPLSQKASVGYQIPVSIPMPVSPFEKGNGFDKIPGLRVTGVVPNLAQPSQPEAGNDAGSHGTWTVTGVLYAHQ